MEYRFLLVAALLSVSTSFASVDLKSAATYAVLAGSTVASTGLNVLNGNVGLHPGTAVTGFPPGLIKEGFSQHIGDFHVMQAKMDLIEAIRATSLLSTGAIFLGGTIDIGGNTMYPGLYVITTTLGVLIGDLTLNAQGDSSATFIFKMVLFL
jgi:hypothetical protein